MGSHFWPFTDVLREIWPAVTQKLRKMLNRCLLRQSSGEPEATACQGSVKPLNRNRRNSESFAVALAQRELLRLSAPFLRPTPEGEDRSGFDPIPDRVAAAQE